MISKDQRNKRKFTTLVVGMETVVSPPQNWRFPVSGCVFTTRIRIPQVEGKTLKEVAKAFSKRFACSASVTKS